MWWSFFKAVRTGQYKVAPMTWLAFAGTIAYTLWPIDFIPEAFLGPIGLIDDLGLWGVMLMLATREKQKWEAQLERDGVIIDAESVR
ncbi:DUF1232 domain-containing protein [Demequina aurantiaca]|uniref:DUF1232 domain-containing protein n=1 Tax=Demequina aurantiaca TaxID=676200 RepID=UPI000783A60C|nr:YkvA family protein [Demequina aurantiaca]